MVQEGHELFGPDSGQLWVNVCLCGFCGHEQSHQGVWAGCPSPRPGSSRELEGAGCLLGVKTTLTGSYGRPGGRVSSFRHPD